MEQTATTTKRHRIYDHKLLGLIAPTIELMVLSIPVAFIMMALGISANSTEGQLFQAVTTVAIALLMLLVFRLRMGGPRDILNASREGFIMVLPAATFALINLIDLGSGTLNDPLYCLIMSLAPGISEEVMFRALPASNWMRVCGEERDILPCTFTTALVFGLVHALNSIAGADTSATAFQVFYAFCMGILLVAVFLRRGSVLPCMAVHALVDFTGFLVMDMTDGGVIHEALVFDLSFYLTVVCSIGMLVCGIYLLRREKRPEVAALWQKKWNKVQPATVVPEGPIEA